MDGSKDTPDALRIIEDARRGCPWLYPLCDAAGACAVVEAGAFTDATPSEFNPLQYIPDGPLKSALPDIQFIQQHNSSELFRKGMYVRTKEWSYPHAFLEFNPSLFELASWPYNSSSWGASDFVYTAWEQEKAGAKALEDNYFPPKRGLNKSMYTLVSNIALVPEMRLTQMGLLSDLLSRSADCAQWRYDQLNAMLLQVQREDHLDIDLEKAKHIITFLSPDRTPGYWTDRLDPHDPMSAQVEGAISVGDLTALRLHTKTGYWRDRWTFLSLLSYTMK